jgi:hypothetical protein
MAAIVTTTLSLSCDAEGCEAIDLVSAQAPEMPAVPLGWIELHKATAEGIVSSVLCPDHEAGA